MVRVHAAVVSVRVQGHQGPAAARTSPASTSKDSYQLVKDHDRVGRMADTWNTRTCRSRRTGSIRSCWRSCARRAPSLVEDEGDRLVIRHLYIERRMVPLNIYLERGRRGRARPARCASTARRSRNWSRPTSSPATCCTRTSASPARAASCSTTTTRSSTSPTAISAHSRAARTPEDEMAAEPWYPIGPHDVFPEEFGTFLLGNPQDPRPVHAHHADLLERRILADRARSASARGCSRTCFRIPRACASAGPAAERTMKP